MLAIVIPYYKKQFFEKTLQSLANQTDQRFKVYVGDDGSLESCNDLIDIYSTKMSLSYFRFDENVGGKSLVNHWKRCLHLVEDESWVMFLGDDDVLGDNVVEAFYTFIAKDYNDINVVRYATKKINYDDKMITDAYHFDTIESSKEILFNNKRSSLSEFIFNKEKLIKTGFVDFHLAWMSDIMLVLEVSNFDNIYTANEALVYVRVSDLSISGKKDNIKLKERAVFEFYYYLLKKSITKFSGNQIDMLYFRMNKGYLNDKKNVNFFLKVTYIYLSRFKLRLYFKFLKSVFSNVKQVLDEKHINNRRRR
jgi:glycosyltransferase involved in cell wall biosynthesis